MTAAVAASMPARGRTSAPRDGAATPARRANGGQRDVRARGVPLAFACVIATVAMPAAVQLSDVAGFVQAGEGDRAVKSVAFGGTLAFAPRDPADPSPWSAYCEAVVGQWFAHHRDPGQPRAVSQFTVAPVLRYTFGGAAHDVFVEVGVGLSLIAPHFADHGRTFSTTFNFDDHASLGTRFGARREHELSVRVEHFSNGGIRNPNPGQNFAQLRYARHF